MQESINKETIIEFLEEDIQTDMQRLEKIEARENHVKEKQERLMNILNNFEPYFFSRLTGGVSDMKKGLGNAFKGMLSA